MKLSGTVAIFRLNNGKANAIDEALLDTLDRLLDNVPIAGARAAVITGYGRFFSSGLALPSLVGLDRPAMRAFINRFSEVMLKLFASPLPVVAAVNGHAIAGGCVLALMADARIMADGESKIGLNEVQLGIGLPASVIEPLRAQVSVAALTPIALEGRLFLPPAARSVGLVHEVVPEAELEARAIKRAQALGDLAPDAYAQVKSALRRPVLDRIAAIAEAETERWLDTWFTDAAQERIQTLVARLTAGGQDLTK